MLDQIIELLDREPFTPFRIRLAGGEEYAIDHPHLVAVGSSQLIVAAPRSDLYSILRLNQITSVDVAQAA
jgi:hypothetical protein